MISAAVRPRPRDLPGHRPELLPAGLRAKQGGPAALLQPSGGLVGGWISCRRRCPQRERPPCGENRARGSVHSRVLNRGRFTPAAPCVARAIIVAFVYSTTSRMTPIDESDPDELLGTTARLLQSFELADDEFPHGSELRFGDHHRVLDRRRHHLPDQYGSGFVPAEQAANLGRDGLRRQRTVEDEGPQCVRS